VTRPPPNRHGVLDPACPERGRLPQLADGDPHHRMCVVCGRITARQDSDGLPWCGGAEFGAQVFGPGVSPHPGSHPNVGPEAHH
jgi:hypothetical protein